MASMLRLCCIISFLLGDVSSIHHPLMHLIIPSEKQCVMEKFNSGDFATFEIFILEAEENGRPSATIELEGPVVSSDVGEINEIRERTWPTTPDTETGTPDRFTTPYASTMGVTMQHMLMRWDGLKAQKLNSRSMQEAGVMQYTYTIDFTYSGESEDAMLARSEFNRQRDHALNQLEQERQRSLARRSELGVEENQHHPPAHLEDEVYEKAKSSMSQTIIPEWIEPYEFTKTIKTAGWYRMCVSSDNEILVELDIRSSAILGGINRDTGHVYTYDERDALDEERRIEEIGIKRSRDEAEASLVNAELGKVLENQVRDNDLEATKVYLKNLSEMISLLQKRQTNHHHRIKGHESDARRNYKKIVRSGMLETALYLLITLFQIYSLRKWLLGNTVLGR